MPSEAAQDKIISALVNAAFAVEDAATTNNDVVIANEIRMEANKLAKRWGISNISGLPGTWKHGKRIPSYK